MEIFNKDISVLGDLTLGLSNAIGDIITIDVTGIVNFRTPSEILSDIGGAKIKIKVYNNTGFSIPGGRIVSINGIDGSGFGYIEPTDATDDNLRKKVTGLTVSDIPDGTYGFIITKGLLENIDTSAIAPGSLTWLSITEPGKLQNTQPLTTIIKAGIVLTSHAVTGSIIVDLHVATDISEVLTKWIDFDTTIDNPTWQEGRVFWDKTNKCFAVYDDESESTLQVGQELRVRVFNDNGVTILNGEAVSVSGVTAEGVVKVELAIASNEISALNTIGIATHDIEIGTYGWATTSGFVNDVNTIAYTEGAAIWLSETVAGQYQETRPLSPSYEVRMGGIAKSHLTDGKIYAELRIISNDHDNTKFLNGSILESHEVNIVSNGTTVNCSLHSLAANNKLSLILDHKYLSVTDGINIDLILGTDILPIENWTYIDSNGDIQTSTSGFPTGAQYVPLARTLVPSAITSQTHGVYKNHVYTDHLADSVGQGHLSHLNSWVRKRPAGWQSGIVLTQSEIEGTTATVINLSYTSGEIAQLHNHVFPIYDTSTRSAFIINDSLTPYNIANGITPSIDTDSLGNSIGTNKYYKLIVWGVVSEEIKDCKLFFNLPSGSYTNLSDALNDIDKTAEYSIPGEYLGTGFLITEFIIQRKVTTVTVIAGGTKDLRGTIPAIGGGSALGGSGITKFDELIDTPLTKIGNSLKGIRINAGETALEYYTTPISKSLISNQFLSSFDSTTGLFTSSNVSFTGLDNIPTTIGGYGITDFNSLGDARWLKLIGGTLSDNLNIFKPINDGNPTFSLGASSTNSLKITSTYSTGTQIQSNIDYDILKTSGLAAHIFKIDGVQKFSISEFIVSTPNSMSITSGGNFNLSVGKRIYFDDGDDYWNFIVNDSLNTFGHGSGVQVYASQNNHHFISGDPGDSGAYSNVYASNFIGNWSGLNSGQFLRSDVAATKTAGTLIFNDGVSLAFGNSADSTIKFNVNTLFDLNAGNLLVRDGTTTRFTFGRTTGDLALTSINGLTQGQFLRSDVSDIKTSGGLTFNDNVSLKLGTDNDADFKFDGTDSIFDLKLGDFIIKDNNVARFTFERTTGNLTTTGFIKGDYFKTPSLSPNITLTSGHGELSGSGFMGNRSAIYLTNNSATGEIKFGIGGTHGSNIKLTIATNGDLTATGAITATNFIGNWSGLTSGQFLRSDAADTKTAGELKFDDNVSLKLGTIVKAEFKSNGTNPIINIVSGDLKIQDNLSERFIFGRTTGNFTATGLGTFKTLRIDTSDTETALLVTGGGVGSALAEFRRDIGAGADGFIRLTVSSGQPQIYFDQDLGVYKNSIGFVNGQFRITNDSTLGTGTVVFTVGATGNAVFAGTVTATNFIGDWSGLNSGQFLRSDVSDLKSSGNLNFSDSVQIRLGTGADFQIFHNGTENVMNLTGHNLNIKDSGTTKFTFGRTTGDLTLAIGDLRMTSTGGYVGTEQNIYGWDDTHTIGVRMITDGTAGEIDFRRWRGTAADHSVVRIGNDSRVNGSGAWGLGFYADSESSNIKASTLRMFISPDDGFIGIGTNNPIYKLDVIGTSRFTSTVTATNFILSSDRRLKTAIKDVDYSAHIDVNWKQFELKSEPGVKRHGVIAQELEKTHPEFVRTDDEGMKSVAYIDLLVAKNAELEARLERMEELILKLI